MPAFPIVENQIYDLAVRMVGGCQTHPTDFPRVNWALLNLKRLMYRIRRNTLADAIGTQRLATVQKDASFAALIAAMKAALKKAEVDTAADPAKLAEIGWGPKAAPQSLTAPDAPAGLTAMPQTAGSVTLTWQKPAEGGPPGDYRIQLRTTDADWQFIELTYAVEITLTRQRPGQTLEYRVLASNKAGLSAPSNTVSVVL